MVAYAGMWAPRKPSKDQMESVQKPEITKARAITGALRGLWAERRAMRQREERQ